MSHTTYIDDVDCGFLGLLQLKVEFDYTPEDDGGNEYPYSPEEYDILHVWIVNGDALIDVSGIKGIDDDALVELIKQERELRGEG